MSLAQTATASTRAPMSCLCEFWRGAPLRGEREC
jgi:hypothetical protein